jgi:ankyrin repeat protein
MIRTCVVCGLVAAELAAYPWQGLAAAPGESPPSLIEAAESGDREAALARIAERADVNAAEADGTTALHWAARSGDRVLLEALLEAGANPAAANRYGVTPLQLAAVNGDAETLQALLDAGADPNATLPEGETVLMTAARTGDPQALRVLLDHGADLAAREHWYGESALIWAAAENHADAVRVLLSYGADVNSRSALQSFDKRRLGQSVLSLGRWTPLMYAARQNALEAGKALIEAHADLDLADPDGATALVIAIINAQYEFAAMLLEAGADPNIVDATGMGALYAAVDMHRLAVGHGRPNPIPRGPLDSVDIVRVLLEHGADPEARLSKPIIQRQHTFGDASLGEGATPFLRAAKSGDIEVMRMLLEAGADPEYTMPDGSTALMYAAGLGWRNGSPIAPSFDQGSEEDAVEAIRMLLDLGLDINAKNDSGNSVLHAAVGSRKSETIVRFLVQSGADRSARNEKGQTPLDLAQLRNAAPESLVALLEPGDRPPQRSAADR